MAENEVSKATEKVERKDQGDRILKQIADDGVVGNDIQQELHSESKKFDNQHNLSDEALIASKEGELLEEYKKRVEEIQNNRFSITGLEDPAPPDKNDSMSTGQMLATGGRDAEMMLEAIGNLPPGEQSAAKKSLKFAYGHSISSSDCPMENLGSDSDGQRIAVSDEQLNRHELKSWRELQVPKDGQSITLKQILEDYKTPFIEAYNHSKQLKEGQSGKSKTLEDIVDRLRGCPWADDIQIKLDRKESNPEYDPERNTMTINPEDTPETQIELFSHEAYHATHQFLHKMYGGLVLGKQEFRDTLLWGEVGSMVSEAKVHEELNLATERPKFFFRSVDGSEDHIVVGDYVKDHGGVRGLFEFLKTAQPAQLDQKPYGNYYYKHHKPYSDNFTQNRSRALKLIQQWVKRGGKAEDI